MYINYVYYLYTENGCYGSTSSLEYAEEWAYTHDGWYECHAE